MKSTPPPLQDVLQALLEIPEVTWIITWTWPPASTETQLPRPKWCWLLHNPENVASKRERFCLGGEIVVQFLYCNFGILAIRQTLPQIPLKKEHSEWENPEKALGKPNISWSPTIQVDPVGRWLEAAMDPPLQWRDVLTLDAETPLNAQGIMNFRNGPKMVSLFFMNNIYIYVFFFLKGFFFLGGGGWWKLAQNVHKTPTSNHFMAIFVHPSILPT